jgi:DNA-binding winged helix-turn-helix (wHTH) protein
VHVRFGPFWFDGAARELRSGGSTVHLSPKAFELLAVLLRHRPKAVSKGDLHAELWPNTFVSDGSLAVLAAEIRRAVGDSARHSSYIRTVNRFGYAFVGSTHDAAAEPSLREPAAVCALIWNSERARLKPGPNVVGRDAAADVCVDALGVSRRHAIIVVGTEAVTVSDLSSKNGTFVNGVRIDSPHEVSDGAEIRLGAVSMQFRRPSPSPPTQTVTTSHVQRKTS